MKSLGRAIAERGQFFAATVFHGFSIQLQSGLARYSYIGNARKMNKSYISVWNDASGTWVAAPETAKTHCGTGVATSRAISANVDGVDRPATRLRASFMPIAMAIGAAMLPGMAFAQAATGNGGLELCPGGVGGTGSSWGILSSSALNCNGANGSAGMSFSLNNGADTSGAWGFNDNAISARVTGYDDGRLVLVGGAGITMQDTVYMSSNNITGLAAGDLSTASTDAVNGSQLYQRTRYFQANSPSDDPSTDAKATGANSVASGPASMAIGRNSSAYGANTAAIAANSVARDKTVSTYKGRIQEKLGLSSLAGLIEFAALQKLID